MRASHDSPDPPRSFYARSNSEFDEALQNQKDLDEWLPITSSRKAKWWYSTFHNVTAMVGAGVLSLPSAMSNLGWGPGVTILILSWIVTLYTLWQMVEMHEIVPGKRFDRYHELGQYAFGEKLGLWIVVPQQLIVDMGANIVYMVTGGLSLQRFYTIVKGCSAPKSERRYFIMIFALVHFVLSHLPNFNSISGVSLAAALMSFSYSTILWAASINKSGHTQPHCPAPAPAPSCNICKHPHKVFMIFNAIGEVAFAYAGHSVVLEIQASIPSTPEKPSKGPMWKGVVVAYILVALCYFPVAIVGYLMFGKDVKDNILDSLENPTWLMAMVNLFIVVHLIGGYQIYAMPVFDMLETVLVKKFHFKPTLKLRFFTRNIYVGCTMLVAIAFPFYDGLLGIFGGFGLAPSSYFLPCIIWFTIYKPRKYSAIWFANWVCIIFGVGVMVLAPIGGVSRIISHSNHFFSLGEDKCPC